MLTIREGELVTKDPSDSKVYVFDWDLDNLSATATLTESTFTITALSPSTIDTALTKDTEARLTSAQATTATGRVVILNNRVTQLRLIAGTLGQTYQIANAVVTDETPAQTKERSFRLLIQNR
jgi:hypothetical protein